MLRIYDADGNMLAENEMDKWNRGAEIWLWNHDEQTLYVVAEEKNGQFGCRHYTLSVIPWSPVEIALRFGPR